MLSFCFFVHQGITMSVDACRGHTCFRTSLLSDIPLAFGGMFGLLLLGTIQRSQALCNCCALLTSYADRGGGLILPRWVSLARQDTAMTLVMWIVAIGVRTHVVVDFEDATFTVGGASNLAAFSIMSGVLVGLSFCVLYICRVLATMVDTFCCHILEQQSPEDAISDWNVLQAVLRKASGTIEHSFFCVLTSCFAALLLGVVDMERVSDRIGRRLIPCLPGALVILCVAHSFLRAASVTDRCARVPSLVNSFCFDLDNQRRHIVEYIVQSDAGFYVFEVRLTTGMALKFGYFMCVVAFTLATKALSTC